MINEQDEVHIKFGTTWPDIKRCEVCSIRINDLGQLQCRDCWALYNAKSTKQHLLLRYSDFPAELVEDAVKKEWALLMKVRALYSQGHTDKLKRIYNGFRDEDDKSNSRDYYELKN